MKPKQLVIFVGIVVVLGGVLFFQFGRKDTKAVFLKGVKLLEAGKAEKALSCFEKVEKKEPSRPGLLYRKGAALLLAGKAQEAVPLLEKALEESDNEGGVSLLLARALDSQGKSDRALEALFEAERKGAVLEENEVHRVDAGRKELDAQRLLEGEARQERERMALLKAEFQTLPRRDEVVLKTGGVFCGEIVTRQEGSVTIRLEEDGSDVVFEEGEIAEVVEWDFENWLAKRSAEEAKRKQKIAVQRHSSPKRVRLVFTDGGVLEGNLTKETEESVWLDIDGAEMMFMRSELREMRGL